MMNFSPSELRIASTIKKLLEDVEDPILTKIIVNTYDAVRFRTRNEVIEEHHETIFLHVKDMEADIDIKIAPLISEIWKTGIITYNSCENNIPANYVWIEFADYEHAKKFIDYISYDLSRTAPMYYRMMGEDEPRWIFGMLPHELNDDPDYKHDNAYIVYTISIRFPQCDLEEVYERFKSWNAYLAENPPDPNEE